MKIKRVWKSQKKTPTHVYIPVYGILQEAHHFNMCSRQFSSTIFTIKLIIEVEEGLFKMERIKLSYYHFLSAFQVKFWREILNGDLDCGLCRACSPKALD